MTRTTGRRGFTLVELLVVIVILGILTALLVPAVMGAIRRGRVAQAEAQINTLAQALASFNSKYGTYPPSRLVFHESGYLGVRPTSGYLADFPSGDAPIGGRAGAGPAAGSAEHRALVSRSVAALRTLFPRVSLSDREPPAAGATLAPAPAGFYDINGSGAPDGAPLLLEGHECLFLFLSGIPDWEPPGPDGIRALRGVGGLHKNPRNPFVAVPPDGAGSDFAAPYYDPERADRMADDDGDGVPGLLDPLGVSSEARYVAYFAADHGGYDPRDVQFEGEPPLTFTLPGVGDVAALGPNPWCSGPPSGGRATRWLRARTYHLLSPGIDRRYGPGGTVDAQGDDWEFPGDGRSVERDNVALR